MLLRGVLVLILDRSLHRGSLFGYSMCLMGREQRVEEYRMEFLRFLLTI